MARFLFIDDEHVSRAHKLRRVVNQPQAHSNNPVLRPEHPWEGHSIGHSGTVLYDERENLFKFWCFVQPKFGPDAPVTIDGERLPLRPSFLCYMTSPDGVRWDRPNLEQVNFNGSAANNILRIGHRNPDGASILHEPDDPDPEKRYKAFFWEHGEIGTRADGLALWSDGERDGMWIAFSRDGIRWRNYEHNPVVPTYSDTGHYVIRDPRTRRYLAFGRFKLGRVISVMESEDFITWSRPRIVLEPDMHELAGPPPISQFYGMSVDLYEGIYIGGLWIYRPGTDGKIDTQLAMSHDGLHWNRVADRQTFMPVESGEDAWGAGMVRTTARYIVRGEKIHIYHGLVNEIHGGPKFASDKIRKVYPSATGLSFLRRDGWVSLDAGDDEALLLTKPMWVTGADLHLNAQVENGGYISVSACHFGTLDSSPNDDALNGFESSIPVQGDSTDHVIRWNERQLRELAGQSIRLRIRMRKAKLFSIWFS